MDRVCVQPNVFDDLCASLQCSRGRNSPARTAESHISPELNIWLVIIARIIVLFAFNDENVQKTNSICAFHENTDFKIPTYNIFERESSASSSLVGFLAAKIARPRDSPSASKSQ